MRRRRPAERRAWVRTGVDLQAALAVAFENDFYGSMNYSMHPVGTMFAFEKHAGSVVQEWAIDNLLPFIHSGLSWDAITPRR